MNVKNQQVKERKDLYRKRQTIVEHLSGTIKRGWSYSYNLLRGLKKGKGEMALF